MGLVLIGASIPLALVSVTLAMVVANIGGVCFAFGLFSSNYPWFGLLGGSVLSSCALVVGRLISDK